MILRLTTLFALLGLAFLLTSCGQGHDHEHEQGETAGEHAHEKSPSGASFKAGQGVSLTDQTRQSIGVEIAEVTERKLPLEIRFSAQVFGEDHKPTAAEMHHAECTAKAAGLMAEKKAGQVRPGEPAQLSTKGGEVFGGVILGITKALAIGDVEVVVGITNSGERLKPGDFLKVTISIPRERAVMTVPKSAVLRTAEGTFVYTLNGDAYFRTAVKTGAEAEGFVEVTDGLLNGDVVVTKPVEKLWLIELRATKGGGHSH